MTQMGKPGWLTATRAPKPKTPFLFIGQKDFKETDEMPQRLMAEKTWSDAPPNPKHANGPADIEWREWGFVADWDKELESHGDAIWSALEHALQSQPPLRDVPATKAQS